MDTARIYVLWHPKLPDGLALASAVYQWYRLPSGFGIPVYYRSAPAPKSVGSAPKPIDLSEAHLNLIVLLVDEHMVSDPDWRRWLPNCGGSPSQEEELSSQSGFRTAIYPVAMHPTAYNLPPEFRRLNYITLGDARGRGGPLAESGLEEKKKALLKSLTEAFARVLLRRDWETDVRDAEVEPPKVRIFLSHAKADGAEEARGLRDYIYQQTQLSAFFDENDIALGGQFADVLDSTIRTGTAALIAVQSDVYAHRPWCRREIQLFREPRTLWNAWHGGKARARRGPALVPESSEAESARRAEMMKQAGIWVLDPLIVVEAMKGKSIGRSIPELGNAPAIRWQQGQEHLYVDTLLRETILRNYHLKAAQRLAAAAPGEAIVNWAPDPMSVCALLAKQFDSRQYPSAGNGPEAPAASSSGIHTIIYPDGGLSGLDLDALEVLYPNLTFITYGKAAQKKAHGP